MSRTYNPLISNFFSTRTHLGKLLTLYSQEIASRTIQILREKNNLKPSEIKKEIGRNIKTFVLSRVLGYLRDERILDFSGGRYRLKDDFTYDLLSKTRLPKGCRQKKEVPLIVRDNADLFNHLFFDRINNILIHILLPGPRTFQDILNILNTNHGQISAATLRYHLDKSIGICGTESKIFVSKKGLYSLSPRIKEIHEVFEDFLQKYDRDIDIRVKKLFNHKLEDLANKDVEIVDLHDPIKKVMHILVHKKYVLVMDSKPRGIITMGNLVNSLGSRMLEKNDCFSSLTAEQIMRPIDDEDILPEGLTLLQVFKKYKRFENNHYIIGLDGSYGILDVYNLVRIIPYIH
jgi:hypothetical protein